MLPAGAFRRSWLDDYVTAFNPYDFNQGAERDAEERPFDLLASLDAGDLNLAYHFARDLTADLESLQINQPQNMGEYPSQAEADEIDVEFFTEFRLARLASYLTGLDRNLWEVSFVLAEARKDRGPFHIGGKWGHWGSSASLATHKLAHSIVFALDLFGGFQPAFGAALAEVRRLVPDPSRWRHAALVEALSGPTRGLFARLDVKRLRDHVSFLLEGFDDEQIEAEIDSEFSAAAGIRRGLLFSADEPQKFREPPAAGGRSPAEVAAERRATVAAFITRHYAEATALDVKEIAEATGIPASTVYRMPLVQRILRMRKAQRADLPRGRKVGGDLEAY
jgi:hypothetical protein